MTRLSLARLVAEAVAERMEYGWAGSHYAYGEDRDNGCGYRNGNGWGDGWTRGWGDRYDGTDGTGDGCPTPPSEWTKGFDVLP